MKETELIDDSILRRYLLGDCSAPEIHKIEWDILTDELTADLLSVFEDELMEEYVTGELLGRDRLLFEQRFLTNPEKMRQVLLLEALLKESAHLASHKLDTSVGMAGEVANDITPAPPFDQRSMENPRPGDFLAEVNFITHFVERCKFQMVGERTVQRVAAVETEALSSALLLISQGWNDARLLESSDWQAYGDTAVEYPTGLIRGLPTRAPESSKLRSLSRAKVPGSTRKETSERVKQILAGMTEGDGKLLKTIFFENQTAETACREAGVSTEYLRVLLHRLKRGFRGA